MLRFAAYRGIGWISDGIKLLTYSPFSHIGILFSEDLTVEVSGNTHHIAAGNVIEAWQGGVRLSESLSSSHTPETPVDIFSYRRELSRTEERMAAQFLISQLGKKYDYLNVARFVPVVRLAISKPIGNLWERKHVFCSELAVEMSFQIRRPLFQCCKAWEIPPRDIPRNRLLRFEKSLFTV